MEKEHQPESMATITMKPEYPPSEVYSTSEPPPAYRQRETSAVQIARIVGMTVVAASFILGAFILASSWVSARSSCHQLEQLDAMLDKELALEGRAYGNDALLADEPLPVGNAHALRGAPPAPNADQPASNPNPSHPSPPVPQVVNAASQVKDDSLNHAESKIDEDKLQKIDDDNSEKDDSPNESEESSDSDSSAEDEEELDAVRPMIKMPIHFDLDDIAGAFLANNNQKGRMNCVVERRQEDPMERRFPFNILGAFAPRAAHAERIAIICHGGDEPRPMNFPEPQAQVFAFPLTGPVRLPLRPQPERQAPPAPPAHPMPGPDARMPPFASMVSHRQAPFPLPLPWDSSEEQQMSGPGIPREMRIHVQRVIAIPSPHNMPALPESMGPFPPLPPQGPPRDQNEQPSLHQFVPQPAPTQEMERPEMHKVQLEGGQMPMNLPWGLTPEDISMIHRTAEDAVASQRRDQQMDNDMQEQVKTIVNTLAAAEVEEQQRQDEQPEEERGNNEEGVPAAVQLPPAAPQLQSARMPRTLLLPQDMPMDERPHYVQPRSVRSVDGLLHRQKRIKRCACDCGL